MMFRGDSIVLDFKLCQKCMDPYYRMDEDYLPEEWRQYRPAAPYRPQSMRWYVVRLFEIAQAVQIEVGKYANERWRDQDLISMVYYSSGDNPEHRKYVKEHFKMNSYNVVCHKDWHIVGILSTSKMCKSLAHRCI